MQLPNKFREIVPFYVVAGRDRARWQIKRVPHSRPAFAAMASRRFVLTADQVPITEREPCSAPPPRRDDVRPSGAQSKPSKRCLLDLERIHSATISAGAIADC